MRTSRTRVAKSTGEPLDFSSPRSPSTIESELYQDRLIRSAEEKASSILHKSILTTCLAEGSMQLLSTLSASTAKATPSTIRPKTHTSDDRDSTHMTLPLSKSLWQGRLDDTDENRKKITSQLPVLQSNDRQRSLRKGTNRKRKRTPSEYIDGSNTSRGRGGTKSTDMMPSRPLSAYNIFFSDQRAKIMAEREANDGVIMTSPESGAEDDGSMNETEKVKKKKGSSPFFERLAKRVGRRWRKLPEEERAKYIVLAKKDKQRYRDDLEALHQKKMTETIERVVAEQVKDVSRSSVVKGTSPDNQVLGVQIEMDSGLPSVPSRPASHNDPSPTQGYETWFASVVMAQRLLARHDFALFANKTGGSVDVHRPNAHWSDIAGDLPLPPSLPGSLDSLTTEAHREMHHRPAILDANQQLTPWNPFLRPDEIILYETLKQQIGSGWQSPGLESFALAHQLLPVDKANHHMQWNIRQRPSEALSSFDRLGQSNLLQYNNSSKSTFAALPRNAVNVFSPSKRQFDVALTTHHLNTQPQSVDILGLASNDDEKVQSIPVLPSTTSTFNKSKGDDHHTSTFQESRSNLLDCESNPSLLLPFLSSRTATSPEKKSTVEEQKIHLKGATTVEEQKIQEKGATSNQGARLTLMNLAVQEFKNQQKPIRHLDSSSLVIGKPPSEPRRSALSKTLRRRNSVIIHQHTIQQQQITLSMIHKSEKETPDQQTEIMEESVQNNTSGQPDNAEHVRILQQLERIRQQYSEQMQKASQNDPET